MAQAAERDFYSVPQAARLLGVSPSTVWRWIEAEKLPAYRVGPKNIRIKKEDLDKVIQPARAKRKAVSPIMERLRAERPSQAELARRQALVKEILALREKCDVAPLTTADLIRQVREEEYRAYGKPRRTR
jgi:excisionase family DNA binding protein